MADVPLNQLIKPFIKIYDLTRHIFRTTFTSKYADIFVFFFWKKIQLFENVLSQIISVHFLSNHFFSPKFFNMLLFNVIYSDIKWFTSFGKCHKSFLSEISFKEWNPFWTVLHPQKFFRNKFSKIESIHRWKELKLKSFKKFQLFEKKNFCNSFVVNILLNAMKNIQPPQTPQKITNTWKCVFFLNRKIDLFFSGHYILRKPSC